MIEAAGLTKTYGTVRAVDDLSFTVEPGRVTGFLGPNGSGKSTTLRMIMGLDRPDRGTATIDGRSYDGIGFPLREVGALLESKAVHPSRTAYSHLCWLAASNQLPRRRIDEVLALTGLESVAHRRAKGFSLGMAQRLGVAAAMLGDPAVLILDEPVNGLDPEGIRWIRQLTRRLADEGRTILVSSHLMSEMALTADHVIVVGRGRLIADTSIKDLVADNSTSRVRLVTPDAEELQPALTTSGATVEADGDSLVVTGMVASEIGEIARHNGCAIHQLVTERASLEDAFMNLTHNSVEYRAVDEAEPIKESVA
ncbi:MAG TPA: ABC transporter ATP-binding protein [Mycobacteriales bacterium]|jgi:ABC-2 type transport system ATP-binding protein|nr:ABC transporter ATP-binding protein [Mycobacteriales bacterium]